MSIQCVVESGNPPPKMQWFLNFQNLTNDSEVHTKYLENDKIYITTSLLKINNISRAENNKSIMCVVHHELLSSDGKSNHLRAMAHFNIECKYTFFLHFNLLQRS